MAYLVQETKSGKESIHSGQFMVSQFEAEEQDDEDNVAVPIPEVLDTKVDDVPVNETYVQGGGNSIIIINNKICHGQQICIDESLSKLFKCMSLAYRQKLTSPKWNRFRGIRLRWKDKIRLNNVIWRCWHLQFIRKENTLVCQFASPLDVDTHNKPEAIVLEGKYWKRKLAAVTAEYKKWRMFYRHHIFGHTPKEDIDMLNDVDQILMGDDQMMIDEDYMGLMSDTLFSTITNQPFVFPDTRELAKSGFADFIQPSLGPLQPNLDDYMDTFDPLQELCLNNKLPTVPEEQSQSSTWEFRDYQNNVSPTINSQDVEVPNSNQYSPQIQDLPRSSTSTIMNKSIMEQNSNQSVMISTQYNNNNNNSAPQSESSSYIQNFPIISKLNNSKSNHIISRGKLQLQSSLSMPMLTYPKQPIVENNSAGVYQVYDTDSINNSNERLQVSMGGKSCTPQEIQQNDQFRTVSDGNSGYKFVTPVRPMITFTSLNLQQEQITSSLSSSSSQVQLHQSQMMHSSAPYLHVSQSSCYSNNFPSLVQNEMKMENKARGTFRGRGRSRSNTREPIKKPPLISAASDPALISPQTNVLLTQLLTNSSPLSEAVQVAYTQNLTNSPDLGLSSSSTINHRRIIKEEITPLSIIPPSSSSSSSILSNNVDSSSSPPNIHSPTSSQGSLGSPGHENCSRDGRRAIHIHAEQKRRVNIRNGFDMIHTLIPQLNENPNAKLSKANMLKTGANYIKQLRTERNQLRDEMDSLRQQIESLNTSISNCQSMLPATGAPVSRRRDSRMQEMFDEYVSKRTMENWKFCIFSLICRPLLNSFNNFVSTTSLDDLYTSTCHWVEQHCTLVDLRPVVLNSLRYLCTKTEILSEPEKLPEEAKLLVLNNDKK